MGGAPAARGAGGAALQREKRLVLHMSRAWRNLLACLLLALTVAGTWFASQQQPHPDMFRPVGLWDFGRADWWAHPLERNAFKRTVVRGGLTAIHALPEGDHVWVVGGGGLILHSADGGRHWEQQRPVLPPVAGAPVRTARSIAELQPSAHAATPSSPQPVTSSNAPPQKQMQPQQQQQQQQQQIPQPASSDVPSKSQEPESYAAPETPTPPAAAIPNVKRPDPAPRNAVRPNAPASPRIATPAPAPTPPRPAEAPRDEPTLYAVHFVSATTGWAVGDRGTVLATRDGGSTWTAQPSGISDELHDVHFAGDGLRGWATGTQRRVIATNDGGKTWSQTSVGTGDALHSLFFLDEGLKGWAVGDGGKVYATMNGGRSWNEQASGYARALTHVRFTDDGLRGWAAGDALLQTSDGGSVWRVQAGVAEAPIVALHVSRDGRRVWAVGHRGTVVVSRDAGATWTAQKSGTRADLVAIRFAADGLTGWALGGDGTVLATQDGGDTWTARTGGARSNLRGSHFVGHGLSGWAVGGDGTLLATRDGGSTWVSQATGTLATLNGVRFHADGLKGYAVGDAGTLLATRDGGRSWNAPQSPTSLALDNIRLSGDGQKGWTINRGGSLFATLDGGSTWVEQADRSTTLVTALLRSNLRRGMHFSSDGRQGWLTGLDGTLLATRDGGSTWSGQASNTQASLAAVHFADGGRRGLAVGSTGAVLQTSDDGSTWTSQTSGTAASLLSVHIAGDGIRAWTAGSDGTILSSRDSGATWTPQTSGTRSQLREIQFAGDGLRGWAVGVHATVLATRDGGATWMEPAQYRRYWPPWYFAALAAAAVLLAALFAWVETAPRAGELPAGPEPVHHGSATTLHSDQPVADKEDDKLGYRIGVEALSSFIRNRKTEPRVTIAVTGEWGTGKSSVMRMLQTDLQRAGFRTAWFNAWHQQQEGRQLTALFNTIRTQAVPSWWSRQFVAALRVRSRLIWGRNWFYKAVAVASAIGFALLLGDLLADGPRTAWAHVRANFAHHVLQQQQTAITGASLAKLDPLQKPAAAPSASPPAAASPTSAVDRSSAVPRPDPCTDAAQRRAHRKAEPVRLAVYCALKHNFLWDHGEDGSHCGVDRPEIADPARRCIFDSAPDLIATLNGHDKDGVLAIWPSEEKAIRAAAETLPPPPLFRWLESSLLGGLAGFIALLLTKGISVYGLQMTAPLRALFTTADKDKDAGKEAAGTIERYRAEFGLLCDALDGRLVIFIDDLDRCTPATVNSLLEMTNYLVDVGRCFVVMGAAIDRVKQCIQPPVEIKDADNDKSRDDYATEYLRKLIHIELPVPLRRAELEKLLRDGREDGQASAARRRLKPSRKAWAWVLGGVCGALLVGVFLAGGWLHTSGDGTPHHVLSRPMTPERLPVAGASTTDSARSASAVVLPKAEKLGLDVGLSAPASTHRPWLPIVLAALVVACGIAWRWFRHNGDQVLIALGGAIRPEDSARFMQALRVWNPVVVEHDPTPRHVKRFFNRARLFAAYENEEARATKLKATDGAALVMMAALHHVDPACLTKMHECILASEQGRADLQAVLRQMPDRLGLDPQNAPADRRDFAECFVRAWQLHLKSFTLHPGAAQVLRFAERMRGINVR